MSHRPVRPGSSLCAVGHTCHACNLQRACVLRQASNADAYVVSGRAQTGGAPDLLRGLRLSYADLVKLLTTEEALDDATLFTVR